MGRVVSPTPTPLSSGRVVPVLVASYDMRGRAVGLFYTKPTGPCGSGTYVDRKSALFMSELQNQFKPRLTILLLLSSPATSLGFTIWGEIFAHVTFFFNPTIKVVTFSLCGWCMLGVFVLPAFTHLGHERQDLLSPCDGRHVCTDQTSVYTLIRKSFGGNGVRTHVNSKGKIPSTGKKNCPQRRIEPTTLHQAGQ